MRRPPEPSTTTGWTSASGRRRPLPSASWIEPARAEAEDEEQHDTHRQEPHVRRASLEVGLQRAVGHAGGDETHKRVAPGLDLDPEEPDQETAENRAPVVAGTADDHHDPDQEGEAQR